MTTLRSTLIAVFNPKSEAEQIAAMSNSDSPILKLRTQYLMNFTLEQLAKLLDCVMFSLFNSEEKQKEKLELLQKLLDAYEAKQKELQNESVEQQQQESKKAIDRAILEQKATPTDQKTLEQRAISVLEHQNDTLRDDVDRMKKVIENIVGAITEIKDEWDKYQDSRADKLIESVKDEGLIDISGNLIVFGEAGTDARENLKNQIKFDLVKLLQSAPHLLDQPPEVLAKNSHPTQEMKFLGFQKQTETGIEQSPTQILAAIKKSREAKMHEKMKSLSTVDVFDPITKTTQTLSADKLYGRAQEAVEHKLSKDNGLTSKLEKNIEASIAKIAENSEKIQTIKTHGIVVDAQQDEKTHVTRNSLAP